MTEQDEQVLASQEEIFDHTLDYCTVKFGLASGQAPKEPTNNMQAALLAAVQMSR